MPKKIIEKEEEIDVKKVEKQETFATRWFRDYAVNNAEELLTVCELTARSVSRQFSINVDSKNYEVYAIIFYGTFVTILDFIRSKQKTYNEFTVEIFNSINLGYTNSTDENNEKVGNFMPIMEYIGVNMNIVNDSDLKKDTTPQNANRWKELNSKKNVECYNEIEIKAAEMLKNEYGILLHEPAAVIPIFCIFMDNINSLMKLKYQEAEGTGVSQVSMNVLSLFDVFYSYDEDEHQEIYEYSPNIKMKLLMKSDDTAARE